MNNMWSAVSAISAMIAVGFAFWSIWITIGDRRADRQARRPYVTVSEAKIVPLPTSPPYRIQITFKNEGFNPATGFEGEILFVNASLKVKPSSVEPLSIANFIPRNADPQWIYDEFYPSAKMSKAYIVIRYAYFDPLLAEKFRHSFVLKWDGVENGIMKPTFPHATTLEKEKVEEYLKTQGLTTGL